MFKYGDIVYHQGRQEKGIFVEVFSEVEGTAYVFFDNEGCEILVSLSQIKKI